MVKMKIFLEPFLRWLYIYSIIQYKTLEEIYVSRKNCLSVQLDKENWLVQIHQDGRYEVSNVLCVFQKVFR